MSQENRDREPIPIDCEAPFRIVTIYDSVIASAAAAKASAVVARELGADFEIDRCSWNVNSLERSLACHVAAGEAARADLIVIALGTSTVSNHVKQWVKQWEKHRVASGGLLAFIPSEELEDGSSPSSLEEYFYETAISANMDFICRRGGRY